MLCQSLAHSQVSREAAPTPAQGICKVKAPEEEREGGMVWKNCLGLYTEPSWKDLVHGLHRQLCFACTWAWTVGVGPSPSVGSPEVSHGLWKELVLPANGARRLPSQAPTWRGAWDSEAGGPGLEGWGGSPFRGKVAQTEEQEAGKSRG